jgi:DNA-binding GntR family transcriptional regulator
MYWNKDAQLSELSTAEKALNELLQGIEEGRYVPGQRIIAGELSRKLNMSRAPVREAIHVLAGEGIVELTTNYGARIRELSPMDLIHGMQLLQAVGALGLEEGVPNLASPKLHKLVKRELDKIRKAGEQKQSYIWFRALIDFHILINDISKNPYLNNQVFNRIHHTFFCRELAKKLPGIHWKKYIRNYEKIGDAVLAVDNKLAVSKYNSHMKWATNVLRKEYLGPL